MVYGIIELINFAHGDLFMLGSVFAAIIHRGAARPDESSPKAWLLLADRHARCDGILRVHQRGHREARLPPAAQRAEAGAADHRRRRQLHPPEHRHPHRTARPRTRGPACCRRGRSPSGRVEIRIKYLVVIAVTIPLLLLMTWIVQKTQAGKAMRATAQDRDASLLMGINVDRIIAYTFALGGALAGAAGTMFVQVNGQTRYDAGFRLGLIAFTAAVLGGVGNLLGAVIGGVLIGVIQGLNDSGLGFFPGQKWTQTVMFSILILMIIFRPGGHIRQASAGEGIAMAVLRPVIILWVAQRGSALTVQLSLDGQVPLFGGDWHGDRLRAAAPRGSPRTPAELLPFFTVVLARCTHCSHSGSTSSSVSPACSTSATWRSSCSVRTSAPGSCRTSPSTCPPSWRDINIHFLDTASPKIPGIHLSFWIVIVIAGCRRGDCGRHHRRADAAVEERLPRTRHARLRRDPARGLPQQRRPAPGHST